MAVLAGIIRTRLIGQQGPAGPAGGGASPIKVVNTTDPLAAVPQPGHVLLASVGPGWFGNVQWRRGAPDSIAQNAGPIAGATSPTYTVTSADVIAGLQLVATFGVNPMFWASAGVPSSTTDGAPESVLQSSGVAITAGGMWVVITNLVGGATVERRYLATSSGDRIVTETGARLIV